MCKYEFSLRYALMKKNLLTSSLASLLGFQLAWIVLLSIGVTAPAADATETLEELRAVEAKLKVISPKLVECTVGLQIGSSRGSGIIVKQRGDRSYGRPRVRQAEPAVHRRAPGREDGAGDDVGCLCIRRRRMAKIITKGDWPHLEPGTEKDIVPGEWCISSGHPGGWQKGGLRVFDSAASSRRRAASSRPIAP